MNNLSKLTLLLFVYVSAILFFSCQKGISYNLNDINNPPPDSTGTGTDTTGTTPPDTITNPSPVDTVIAGTLSSELSYFFSGTVYSNVHYFSAKPLTTLISSNYYPQRQVHYNSAGKMTRIDTYLGDNSTGFEYDNSENLVYNSAGNVIAIIETDSSGSFPDTVYSFAYNSAGQMIKKTSYADGTSSTNEFYAYDNNGNVVQLQNNDGTYIIEYDNRINRFNDIHPQYQFLDPALVFDYTGRNQIFYNSKNYPVKMTNSGAVTMINIEVTADGKPSIISYDGEKWYAYGYN